MTNLYRKTIYTVTILYTNLTDTVLSMKGFQMAWTAVSIQIQPGRLPCPRPVSSHRPMSQFFHRGQTRFPRQYGAALDHSQLGEMAKQFLHSTIPEISPDEVGKMSVLDVLVITYLVSSIFLHQKNDL